MISIIQRPERFTPSGNPIIWQVETDNVNLKYFRVDVLFHPTNAVINSLNIRPTPDDLNGGYIDLSKLLSNVVDTQLDNDAAFIKPLNLNGRKPVAAYRLKITEMLVSGATVVPGDELDDATDINYVFDACFDRVSFNVYTDDAYVIKGTNSQVKFLTYKPNRALLNKVSSDFLYFMQDGTADSLKVVLKIYNADNTVSATHERAISDLATYKCFRINASFRVLKQEFAMALTDGMYITLQVQTNAGQSKSETKRFDYRELECHLELLNVYFVNSIAGIDSYQFVNPTDQLTATRVTIKKFTHRLSNGIYSNISNNIYNSTEEIINTRSQVKVTMHTRPLNDETVAWLGEMVASKQLYIELTDGKLVPVKLVNTTYNYQRTKYLKGQLNMMKFEIQLPEQIIPAIMSGFVSYIANSTFYNKEQVIAFQKQGCVSPGEVGEWVDFTVPAGTYSSEISQQDADNQAIAFANGGAGQAYADITGVCLPAPQYGNTYVSGTYYKTCPAGEVDSTGYFHSIAADTYFSYDSVAAATAIAQSNCDSQGQAIADANGTCVAANVGNQQQSEIFYSQACPSNEAPDPYTFIVPANTYFSYDQASANQLAIDYLNSPQGQADGQAAADLNGGCTPINIINLSVSVRTNSPASGLTDVYFTVYASAATTDNISVNSTLTDDQGSFPTLMNPAYIYQGNMSASEVYAGQMSHDPGVTPLYTVTIDSVSPNPDSANTSYTY